MMCVAISHVFSEAGNSNSRIKCLLSLSLMFTKIDNLKPEDDVYFHISSVGQGLQ